MKNIYTLETLSNLNKNDLLGLLNVTYETLEEVPYKTTTELKRFLLGLTELVDVASDHQFMAGAEENDCLRNLVNNVDDIRFVVSRIERELGYRE